MKGNRVGFLQAVFLAGLLVTPTAGQKGGLGGGGNQGSQGNQGGGSGQGNQGGGGGSQGTPGLSYTLAEWPKLGLPDVKGPAPTFKNGRMVSCYRLVTGNSSSQPFLLERVKSEETRATGFYRVCAGETDTEGRRQCKQDEAKQARHWNACSTVTDKTPLLSGQELVVGIDLSELNARSLNLDQVKLLNISVTNQQSTPLNPSPVRPTFPGSGAGGWRRRVVDFRRKGAARRQIHG